MKKIKETLQIIGLIFLIIGKILLAMIIGAITLPFKLTFGLLGVKITHK